MKSPNILKHFILLLLMISSVVLPQSAFANYASSCAGCHGQLLTSSKKGASASNIQSAINNNKGNMGILSSLTPAEVSAIAVELGATPVPVVKPTPATTPVPVAKPTPATTPVPVAKPTPATTPIPVVKPTPAPIVLQTPPTNTDDDDEEDDHDSNHHGKSDKNEKHHTHSGSVGKNKSGAAKTDSYEVTCAKGTKSLAVSVMDLNPPKDPLISIQAFKGKRSSPLSIDKVDGDAKYSHSEILPAGAGTYTINVNKGSSKAQGSEAYTAKFSCQNANGLTTSSKLKPVKDQ